MRGEVLNRGEVTSLLRACVWDPDRRHERGVTGHRNAALLAVLYRSGARISEALGLRLVDVDRRDPEIRIRRGKGGKGRAVPVDAECMAFVDRWLDHRAELGAKRIDPLFCTLKCGPVSDDYVRRLMPRLAKRAELGRRVHAHAFRHSYAAELAREGVPMPIIQRLLGHASLETTATYLASLVSPAELEAVARARPRWTA